MTQTRLELPPVTWMECSWCGVQAIIIAEPEWKARTCQGCNSDVPRSDWGSVEELDDVQLDTPAPKAAVVVCGLRFSFDLDLTLYEIDKDKGERDEDGAGWWLSDVSFSDPDEFLEEYQGQLVDLLGGTSVDPAAGRVPIKAWYQARLVLAAAWVEQRRGQRERASLVTPWKSIPYVEGVVLDQFTRGFLADLLGVHQSRPVDLAPLGKSQ